MPLIAVIVNETTRDALRSRAYAMHRDVSKHLRALIEADLRNATAPTFQKDTPPSGERSE